MLQVHDDQIEEPEHLTLPFINQVGLGVMDQGGCTSSLPLTTVRIGQEIMTPKDIRVALMFVGPIFDFHLFKTHHKM